jgi:hypothetical protein
MPPCWSSRMFAAAQQRVPSSRSARQIDMTDSSGAKCHVRTVGSATSSKPSRSLTYSHTPTCDVWRTRGWSTLMPPTATAEMGGRKRSHVRVTRPDRPSLWRLHLSQQVADGSLLPTPCAAARRDTLRVQTVGSCRRGVGASTARRIAARVLGAMQNVPAICARSASHWSGPGRAADGAPHPGLVARAAQASGQRQTLSRHASWRSN